MPMQWVNEGGRLGLSQTFGAPSIYFDHWAIRTFSDDMQLQDRLTELVHCRGATFVLSTLNLAEFSGPEDVRHAEAAEAFLNRLLPNVYVTDFSLDVATEKDTLATRSGLRAFMPHSRWALQHILRSSKPTGQITLTGLIAPATVERARLRPDFSAILEDIQTEIVSRRSDPEFARLSRASRPDAVRPRLMVVMGELVRTFVTDELSNFTTHDASDLIHAAIPLLGCNFVLLDAPWEHRVAVMQRRIQDAGVNIPTAQCFSRRNSGLDRFLEALRTS